MNEESRRAIYLLRMVVDDAVNCSGCRGWLVVGRLDAAPTKSASATNSPVVRSAAELALLLGTDRASWIGRALLVDGTVSPGTGPELPADGRLHDRHPRGHERNGRRLRLHGIDAGSRELASILQGVLAVVVRQDGLEYLGYMGYNTDNSFVLPAEPAGQPGSPV